MRWLLWIWGVCFCVLAVAATSKSVLLQRIELLNKQQTSLQTLIQNKSNTALLDDASLAKSLVDIEYEYDAYLLELKLAQAKLAALEQQLLQLNKQLNVAGTTSSFEKLKPRVNEVMDMRTLRQEQIALLNQNINLTQLVIDKYQKVLKQQELKKIHQQRLLKTQTLQKRIKGLREQNEAILAKELNSATDSNQQAVDVLSSKDSFANWQSALNTLEIEMLQLTIKLNYNDYLKIRSDTLTTLAKLIERLNFMDSRVNASILLIEAIHQNQQKQLKNLQTQAVFKQQQQRLATLAEHFKSLKKLIQQHLLEYQKERAQLLESRKGLFHDSLGQGQKVLKEIIELPKLFGGYILGLYSRVMDVALSLSMWQQISATFAGLLSLCFWYIGRRQLLKFVAVKEQSSQDKNLYAILVRVLLRNWSGLWLLALVYCILAGAYIPFSSSKLVFAIFGVWFSFRTIINVTRLALLETVSNVSGLDVHLYHRLRWTFIVGGLVTLGTVLSHHLTIHYLVRELFDRLFMLFLFMVSIVLLRGHYVLLMLLHNYLNPQKFYTKRALDLITLLIPGVLLINGALGMVGYVQLAWEMSYYQAVVVIAVIGYVIIRGLLLDGLELLSEKMIAKLDNGWLWMEAFLKPIHQILRYLVIALLIVSIFRLYGWDSNASITNAILNIWHFNLFSFSRATITTKSLIEFLVMFALLVWIARWSREFCYRWVYHNVVDLGLRNSLAVFSQYAAISIGTIITLNVLGIDISGISMILGGLAVGMGFGLRDFANNIIGGVMLLIERPVKEGDLISVDNIEGRVTHIGIRSMHVKSWDNFEVVIPNADTFSKPFTNWTHKDSVVRTVVPIKVNRHDSPAKVQQLVLDVLKIIPEVLTEPAPQVYLKHIDDALIEFEIRYYVNVEKHSRFEVRSSVLFAIMAQFKAAGIKAPIPPIHIEQHSVI